MASPQIENGYVRIASELFDALVKTRFSGEMRQVLDCVLRKTYGWNKKSDVISLSQFEKATGLTRPNICRALRRLIARNIVVRTDKRKGTSYRVQKNYQKWKPLSEQTSVVKSDKTRCQNRQSALSDPTHTIDTITKDTTTIDKIIYSCERFKITAEQHQTYQQAYPDIDHMQQYKIMAAWVMARPRKWQKRPLQGVNGWLRREQAQHDGLKKTADILKAGSEVLAMPPAAQKPRRVEPALTLEERCRRKVRKRQAEGDTP